MNLLEKVDSVEDSEEEEDQVIEEKIEDQEVNLIPDHLQGKFNYILFV